MELNLDHYRELLAKEEVILLRELGSIARPDSKNPANWQAVPDEKGTAETHDEVADRLEELEDREATTTTLEIRLREVRAALERINGNTYGLCRIGSEAIEVERLEANPAATTCKKHLESKG